jgi:hypothetical protein
VLAWPRGGGGELRRSAAHFLDACAQVVRETASFLTASHPAESEAITRANEAKELANASYAMYQTERRAGSESTVDWQAVLAAGYHVTRGSELLRDTYQPGSLSAWRPLVTDSATNVYAACGDVAKALQERRDPRLPRAAVAAAPDNRVADVQVWLGGIADDLTRV